MNDPPLRTALSHAQRTPYRWDRRASLPYLPYHTWHFATWIPDNQTLHERHYTPIIPPLDPIASHVSLPIIAWIAPSTGTCPLPLPISFLGFLAVSPYPRQLPLCMLPLTASARGAIMHSRPASIRMPPLPRSLPTSSKANSRSR
jgi:hypothetical protein